VANNTTTTTSNLYYLVQYAYVMTPHAVRREIKNTIIINTKMSESMLRMYSS